MILEKALATTGQCGSSIYLAKASRAGDLRPQCAIIAAASAWRLAGALYPAPDRRGARHLVLLAGGGEEFLPPGGHAGRGGTLYRIGPTIGAERPLCVPTIPQRRWP